MPLCGPALGLSLFVSPQRKHRHVHFLSCRSAMSPRQMDEGWSGRGRGKRERRAARKVRAALTNRDKTGK